MSKSDYKYVLLNKDRQISTITLNRPDELNALSPDLVNELYAALKEVKSDKDTRAVVITGAGRAFCAGGDIELDVIPVSKMRPIEWRKYVRQFTRVIKLVYYLDRPVIAAVNGVTVGGGCDLAMACDIRMASTKAKFGYGYIKVGIISDLGGSYLLPRLVGAGRAKLFAFTGDLIDAKEAERIGLVDKLVEDDKFYTEVQELALKIAQGPTAAIALVKEAMRKASSMDLNTAIEDSINLMSTILDSNDFVEGYSAFLQKRSPAFKGK